MNSEVTAVCTHHQIAPDYADSEVSYSTCWLCESAVKASSDCGSDSHDRAADLRVELVSGWDSAGWCELQWRPSACEEALEP